MSSFYIYFLSFVFNFIQVQDAPISEIELGFNQGNANSISSYSTDRVLISLLGKESIYSQTQATQLLKDFFQKKPPTSFKINFSTKESTEGFFAAGNYVSKSETFRVTIRLKKVDSDYKIERITIDNIKYH